MVVPDEPRSGPVAALASGGHADEPGFPESRIERMDFCADRPHGRHTDVDGARDRVSEHDWPGWLCGAVRAYLPAKEREPWIWGLALQAVSPFAIRLSRKIWPPSILTPLLLLLWIAIGTVSRAGGRLAGDSWVH